MKNRKPFQGMLSVAILLILSGSSVGAATLHVRTNGLDTLTCGAVATPCRSIGAAIAHAVAKDRILVGPGRYGDLNGNGVFGEPGEETGSVVVNKPLTLESVEGAGATIIDMGGAFIDVVKVVVGAEGSVIGLPSRGFTFSGGGWGLSSDNPFPGQLSLGGNIAVNNFENGFLLHDQATYVLTGNLAIRNGSAGFLVHGGTSHKIRGNSAVSNGFEGFRVNGSSGMEISGNLAVGNGTVGYYLFQSTGAIFRGNSALANKVVGVALFGTAATVTQNNIFGNAPATNCGLSVGDFTGSAVNNFFGASTGPGSDPADGVCVESGSIVVTPFAPLEFAISTTWK